MNKLNNIFYCLSISLTSISVQLFGSFDSSLLTLFILMALDIISGIMAAVYISINSKTSKISSTVMWKGLLKKTITIILVIISYRLDILLQVDYIRTSIVIAFIVNEVLSIIENAANMGIKVPQFFTQLLSEVEKNQIKKGE